MLIQLITYLFLPLTIAYITIVITKRREVELDAQGQLLEHRVQAYSEVYRFMRQNFKLIVVPRYLEQLYTDCLEGSDYKIGVQGMEYVSYFSDIDRLEGYTNQLEQLLLTNDLYLEPKLKSELNNLQQWVSDVVMFLKAFRSTEEAPHWQFDDRMKRLKVHDACGFLGIALQGDIQRFTDNIEPLLKDKLRHPKIRRWQFDTADHDNHHSYLQSQLVTHAADIVVRLMYLHYADRYTPTQFDNLPDAQRMSHLESFYSTFRQHLR